MLVKIENTPDFEEDPHLSEGTKAYLRVINSNKTPTESLPIDQARQSLVDAQNSVDVDVSGIEEYEQFIEEDVYTIKLTIVRPEGKTEKLPAFIFFHGGGWVLGDYPTHKRLVRDLVVESGFACVFVNYTPSPEARFPLPVNEGYAALKWVSEHGDQINVDGTRLAVVGNSAGGNMTLAVNILASIMGPAVKCQVAMWPVTSIRMDFDSWQLYGKQRFLTDSLMTWMFEQYLPEIPDPGNGLLSPLDGDIASLTKLPPTLIEVAENDILRDEGEAMGRKLDQAGVPVTTIRYNGVTHDWGLLNGFARLPQTRDLITFTAAFLKRYLS